MTITFRAATGITAAADVATPFANLAYTLPTGHLTGDLLIACYGGKPFDTVPSTPTNYAANSGGANGTTANSAGGGSVYAVAFTKTDGGAESNPASTMAALYSPAITAMVALYESVGNAGWTVTSTNGSDAAATGTTFSATGAANLSLTTGDMIVVLLVHNDDSSADSSFAITAADCTVGTVTQRLTGTLETGTGNDGRMYVLTASITAGTSTAAPVVTATTGNADSDGQAVFLRVVSGARNSNSTSVALAVTGTATGAVATFSNSTTVTETVTGTATGTVASPAKSSDSTPVALTATLTATGSRNLNSNSTTLALTATRAATILAIGTGDDDGNPVVALTASGSVVRASASTTLTETITGTAAGSRNLNSNATAVALTVTLASTGTVDSPAKASNSTTVTETVTGTATVSTVRASNATAAALTVALTSTGSTDAPAKASDSTTVTETVTGTAVKTVGVSSATTTLTETVTLAATGTAVGNDKASDSTPLALAVALASTGVVGGVVPLPMPGGGGPYYSQAPTRPLTARPLVAHVALTATGTTAMAAVPALDVAVQLTCTGTVGVRGDARLHVLTRLSEHHDRHYIQSENDLRRMRDDHELLLMLTKGTP